jgi:hypothetical protein
MAGRYLVLDVSTHGMDAALYERRLTKTTRKAHVFLNRKVQTEPDTETETSWFQETLDILAGEMDLSSCDEALVTVSFPEVCFRNISLPFTHENKIAQVLPFELTSCLPGDSYVSDYFLSDIRFVQDQQLLLTASAPDPMIEDIAMCLWSRKISPAIITPKGHAMAAVFMGTQKPLLDAVFIHSEPAQTAMTLFIKSKPVMVRTIPVSNPSDETIAENLLRLVKGFRHRSGLETRFHVYLTREPAPADPIQAIRKLKPLMNRNPAYFTGDITPIDSNVIPLTDYLMRKPRYLFNWSQNKYGPGTFFSRFKPELLTTAVIGLMVVFLSIFGLYRNLSALEEQILDARRAGFEIYRQTFPENDIQAGHSPLLLMQARVKQAMQRTGTDMQLTAIEHSSGIPAVDVLHELSVRIPAKLNMQLTRLLLNQGQITISGTTNSFNHVDKLKNALAQSPLFKAVTIQTADAGETENQVVFQFRIDM